MSPSRPATTLEQAEGYMMLELFEEAWLALQQLSLPEAASPAALRVKMCTAAGLGNWEIAHDLAQLLRHGDPTHRLAAACCFHYLAGEYYRNGRIEDAGRMIREAIHTRPEQQLILSDPRFPLHFLTRWDGDSLDAVAL